MQRLSHGMYVLSLLSHDTQTVQNTALIEEKD